MSKVTIPDYCELTIKRANGKVECVNYTDATRASKRAIIKTLRPQDFKALQAAYKAAGQELLSYRNVTKEVESASASSAEAKSDADYKAKKAIERMGAGGERRS